MTMQSQVPARAATFFGTRTHPVIAEVFTPAKGWKRHPLRAKRVSRSELLRLRREGALAVALSADGRVADFTITELLSTAQD